MRQQRVFVAGAGLLRHPGHRIAVVLEPLRALERVFAGVHHEIPLIIILAGDLDRVEGYGDRNFGQYACAANRTQSFGRTLPGEASGPLSWPGFGRLTKSPAEAGL